MKITKYLFFLFICLFLNACSDDNKEPGGGGGNGGGGGKDERPETLAWIEDTMREHYYWYNEIPAESKLKYDSGEESFFYSLLTTKDGKVSNGKHYPYSFIEDLSTNTRSLIQESYSYGIDFTPVNFGRNTPQYFILINFVVPNSPADGVLKRGDWILMDNDNYITTSDGYLSFLGDGEKNLVVARWDPDLDDFTDIRENVQLPAARAVIDNPVSTHTKIKRGEKSVGYLLYNHFTVGTGNNDKSYDNELRMLSANFKGVDEFVLDLRYNGGGALSSAMLLCAILCPESYLDKTLGYLKYNDKNTSSNGAFKAEKAILNPSGKNLNLDRIYVLTSSYTASASEVIINSLRVFMDVIVIGDITEGKNVGSITFPDNNNPYPYGTTTWSMHPIVCQISNADNFTDYSDGFKPGTYKKGEGIPTMEGVYIDEAFDYITVNGSRYVELAEVLPFGDENERMLKVALEMIDGTYQPTRSAKSIRKNYEKVPFNSLDRKVTKSVIIDINQ